MKATFNQLHNWKQTSEYWQLINNLSNKKKNQRIKYKDGRNGIYINLLWDQLRKEFNKKFKSEFSIHKHFDLITQKEVEPNTGVIQTVYIHTSLCSCLNHKIDFSIDGINFNDHNNYFSFTPHNNILITKESIRQAVFNYIEENILFPAGTFRDLQLIYGMDKKLTIEYYKTWISNDKKNKSKNDFEYNFDFESYFKRRYNIIPGFDITFESNSFAVFCKSYIDTHGKPETTKTVCKFNTVGLLDNFDGDIDEAEKIFWNYADSFNENTILV